MPLLVVSDLLLRQPLPLDLTTIIANNASQGVRWLDRCCFGPLRKANDERRRKKYYR